MMCMSALVGVEEWDPINIDQWLTTLGLREYLHAFLTHSITGPHHHYDLSVSNALSQ